MDWKECCDKRIVKDAKPNADMIKSLAEYSENKLKSESRLAMSDVTAVSKVFLAYDSLRELLEALALKNGYKVYNHECYTAFLKEILEESEKGDMFNKIRKIRNALNYYGKDITTEEADEIIARIRGLRKSISILLKT